MIDYERAAEDLAGAIRLGYETKQEDPNFAFDVPADDEIQWWGAWLASEGFSRPNDWARATDAPRYQRLPDSHANRGRSGWPQRTLSAADPVGRSARCLRQTRTARTSRPRCGRQMSELLSGGGPFQSMH